MNGQYFGFGVSARRNDYDDCKIEEIQVRIAKDKKDAFFAICRHKGYKVSTIIRMFIDTMIYNHQNFAGHTTPVQEEVGQTVDRIERFLPNSRQYPHYFHKKDIDNGGNGRQNKLALRKHGMDQKVAQKERINLYSIGVKNKAAGLMDWSVWRWQWKSLLIS